MAEPTTEAKVLEAYGDAVTQTNPGVVGARTFDALVALAHGIDELRAEVAELRAEVKNQAKPAAKKREQGAARSTS